MFSLQKTLKGFTKGLLFLIRLHFHQKHLLFVSELVDLVLEMCRGLIRIFNWCVPMNFLIFQSFMFSRESSGWHQRRDED